MPSCDFSYIDPDGYRRVATVDLDTAGVTGLSAPGPTLDNVGFFGDSSAPGCRLPDGRYVFPASLASSGNVVLHILAADRLSWSIVETTLGNNINDPQPIQRPDGTILLFYGDLSGNMLAQAVDVGSGADLADFGPYTPPNVGGVDSLEVPSLVDGTTVALTVTGDPDVWGVDVVTGAGLATVAAIPPVGIPAGYAQWPIAASAYHPSRRTVFAYAFASISGGTFRSLFAEVDYATGTLVNHTTIDGGAYLSVGVGVGVVSGDYFAVAGGNPIGIIVYDITAAASHEIDPAVPGYYSDLWLIPNTGGPALVAVHGQVRQRQIPGKVRQRQIPGLVRQRRNDR